METFKKINSHTWILTDEAKNFQKTQRYIDEQPFSKSKNFTEKKQESASHKPNYEELLSNVFASQKFIGQKNFHKIINENFGGNATYHRKKMINLNLITQKNHLIKLI
ncbi:MAG: hypothetical protein LBE36_06475 [Flavobacteriaceae bacterium]|jgi:hypothetical protein|nr:hypothetical protein [Flavobacteriaceae bacterium]